MTVELMDISINYERGIRITHMGTLKLMRVKTLNELKSEDKKMYTKLLHKLVANCYRNAYLCRID
jgi:hypothetical protein